MGHYTEYLNKNLTFDQLAALRKEQLSEISRLRGGREILAYAADLTDSKNNPISIDFSDKAIFEDQLSGVSGDAIDIILETPGGSAEVVEDFVNLLRAKFERVGMIIPGCAKSAGTIFAMAADEILMGDSSALGPIDAQIIHNGKRWSAGAFLEFLETIKRDLEAGNKLNPAYIPILQGLSPGEIQHMENVQAFSQTLVKAWLATYKFKYWTNHSSDGRLVTPEEKISRAAEIAGELCNHTKWLTHSRSIRLSHLREMKLEVIDYQDIPELNEAIRRYYTLARLTFERSAVYKFIETKTSQIYRISTAGANSQKLDTKEADGAIIDYTCSSCKHESHIQADLGAEKPLQANCIRYPRNDVFKCPKCATPSNLEPLRLQLEAQSGKKVVKSGR